MSKESSYGQSSRTGGFNNNRPRMIASATHKPDLAQSVHVSPHAMICDRVSVKSQLRGKLKHNLMGAGPRVQTASVR